MSVIHHADVLDALRAMPDNSFHGCLTDPPYGLSFMGHQWDHGVPSAEVWREVLRVLRPGAHLLAFGGTRTFHRLTCAIEDAGFEVRDCLMWLYGSGFPKSHDVSKALDQAAGARREVVGPDPEAARRNRKTPQFGGTAMNTYDPGYDGPLGRMAITAPATEAARQWAGHGTALKPAHESIVFATKPIPERAERVTIVENLSRVEAQLWSMLPASVAQDVSGCSQSEYDAAMSGSAPWSADERSSTLADLSALTDTSQFVTALVSCLSTVASWKRALGESSAPENTFTIGTGSSTTIDWRTLRCFSSEITPRSIIPAAIQRPGAWWYALDAARIFHAVAASIESTRMLSALGPAIARQRTSRQARGGPEFSPNFEPIILARKPLEGTVAANVQRWGCGALAIDASRVEGLAEKPGGKIRSVRHFDGHETGRADKDAPEPNPLGRWPANVILDEEAGAALDAQSGSPPTMHAGDSGGASRFFYCAKASRKERDAGLEDFEIQQTQKLNPGGMAARREEAGLGLGRNVHPTVKPLALTTYLARLILPPVEGSRLLVPFCGSGSEMLGGTRAGWSHVEGIDSWDVAVKIARARTA